MKQINYIGNTTSVNFKKIIIKKNQSKCPDSKGCAK